MHGGIAEGCSFTLQLQGKFIVINAAGRIHGESKKEVYGLPLGISSSQCTAKQAGDEQANTKNDSG
jgi:hypothetical protein